MASVSAVAVTDAIRERSWSAVIVNAQVTIGLAIVGVMVVAAIVMPIFITPQMMTLGPLDSAPSLAHPMGVGTHSQDIFSEWGFAARYSLTVGLTAGVASTALSVLIGVTAGYAGGWIDDLLSLLIRVVLLVPPLPALFVVAFALGTQGMVALIALLTVMTWAYGADLLRSQTVALRQREFVSAAITSGEHPLQVMARDIVPHLRGLLLFVLVNAVLFALQAEFGLEFVGWDALSSTNTLGGGWGIMMNNAYYDNDFFAGVWWTWVFPGLGITLTTAALALISAGLAGRKDR